MPKKQCERSFVLGQLLPTIRDIRDLSPGRNPWKGDLRLGGVWLEHLHARTTSVNLA